MMYMKTDKASILPADHGWAGPKSSWSLLDLSKRVPSPN